MTKTRLSTGLPLTRIRSRTSHRCGDVKRPVEYPELRRIDSVMAQVDPLPFVPVTWMTRSLLSWFLETEREEEEGEGGEALLFAAPLAPPPSSSATTSPALSRHRAITSIACSHSQALPSPRERPEMSVPSWERTRS